MKSLIGLSVGKTKYGNTGLEILSIRCVSKTCNEVFLHALLSRIHYPHGQGISKIGDPVAIWTLRPDAVSKVQPDYIPQVLQNDYFEACLIRDKSPKASATLSRRCLQGMIRDFCNISKSTLAKEIEELKKQIDSGSAPKGVEPETIDAIDAVRSIGNIGAHMERDINLIVEVEPGEAQALIELIELLFEEWYVARHSRQERLARIQQIAHEKKQVIAAHKVDQAILISGPASDDPVNHEATDLDREISE